MHKHQYGYYSHLSTSTHLGFHLILQISHSVLVMDQPGGSDTSQLPNMSWVRQEMFELINQTPEMYTEYKNQPPLVVHRFDIPLVAGLEQIKSDNNPPTHRQGVHQHHLGLLRQDRSAYSSYLILKLICLTLIAFSTDNTPICLLLSLAFLLSPLSVPIAGHLPHR